MRYTELINKLQNLTNKKITDRLMMEAFRLKSPSGITSRKKNNSYITDEEIERVEKFFNIVLLDAQDNCITLPICGEVYASMGYGIEVYNENQTGVYSISEQLIKDLGISKDNSEIIFGRGNSMEPTIFGGDALLVDKSKKEINDGRIYCIRYDGRLLTKRLQKLSRAKVKIISDNKDYEPITIDLEKEPEDIFKVIGEVRWSGRVFK